MNLRLFVLIVGLVIIAMTFLMLARKLISPTVSLIWFAFGGIMFLFAVLPFWGVWMAKVDPETPLPLIIMVAIAIFAMYCVSMGLSDLARKNRELAMQVSLLNQESELLQRRVDELQKELKNRT